MRTEAVSGREVIENDYEMKMMVVLNHWLLQYQLQEWSYLDLEMVLAVPPLLRLDLELLE